VDTTPATAPARSSLVGLGAVGLVLAAAATMLLAAARVGDADGPEAAPAEASAGTTAETTAEAAQPGSLTAGSERDHAFWGLGPDGDPLRWDACTPIRFVLNIEGAPDHAERDLSTALRMLADASGLDLVLESRTDERPSASRPLVERVDAGWRWRPVLVAWTEPGDAGLPLESWDRGIALPVAVEAEGRIAFVTGQLVMNAQRPDLVPGFGDRRDAIGATLVHELGHILGLDHVEDRAQLMSADPGAGPVQFGDGDLRGLRAIGADAGCLPAPDAASGRGLSATP
jgi:hypothetical protein